jgi:hypothetical protein
LLTPAENTDKIKEKNGQFMHQRSHVLQLEEEVQRAGSGGVRRLRQLEEENAQLKRMWRTWRWTNRCCRTCYKESFEVAAASAAGEHAARGVIASQSDALVRPYKSILWKFCENKKADEYMFVNPNSKKALH